MKPIILITFFLTYMHSVTTMCYKKGYSDIASIEDQNFNGGLCAGVYSINSMQKNGWVIKDIKIIPQKDSYDFIYILQTLESTTNNSNTSLNFIKKENDDNITTTKNKTKINFAKVDKNITNKINNKAIIIEQTIKPKIIEKKQKSSIKDLNQTVTLTKKDDIKLYQDAIVTYQKYCQSCHGEKGNNEPYGTSRAISKISQDDFIKMMLGYKDGSVNKGNAILMRPYATYTNEDLNIQIHKYLQNLNK